MKKKKGFTLIEVLVVILIVAILSSLSMVAFAGARKTSRDQKRKADLEQIRSAVEIYRSDCLTYPASLPSAGSSLTGCPPGNETTYLSSVPSDPGTYSYRYNFLGANSYCLCAYLEVAGSGTSCECGGDCGSGGVACNYFVTNP